ncbi:gephyrin-like molybdotransferase Glp [Nesterenkonia alba]|uniref:molybdopterin molybdotransferase MoeA n=1 Tax=Nesterenkonia alba TaxID=515814 RepID=UPI0003B48083|nr:gephyrin-like molybdotransferase Glp [Nesterenkonia alba]
MHSHSTSRGSSEQGKEAGIAAGEQPRASVAEHIGRLREVLAAAVDLRGTESLPVTAELAGRLAAVRITAPGPLPGFDNSQMDGFAVRSADVTPGETTLPLAGIVAAGSAPGQLPAGAAIAVMTGAAIPTGADVVVPVEKTRHGFTGIHDAADSGPPAEVTFTGLTCADLTAGQYIRRTGSDIATHDVLAEAGELLTPQRVGVLAACGIDRVEVFAPVSTLVISTGEELRSPGQPLHPGELYDANAPLIGAVLQQMGHRVSTAQLATDDPETFTAGLTALITAHHPQLILTAGGVSAGAFEVVRQVLSARGIRFGTVAQQPGGPQGWGILDAELPVRGRQNPPIAVVCLPGNPVSAAVSVETLLRPALSAVDPSCPPPRRVAVRLAEPLSSRPGLRQYRRVELEATEDGVLARAVGGPSSHLLGHLARADALLELTEDDVEVAAGTHREAILLPGRQIRQGAL